MALNGDLTVARSTSLALASAGPLGVSIFTPFAYASADLKEVWGESLYVPVFAGITAGTCSFWGVFTLNVGFSGAYDFDAVDADSVSITFSLAPPASVSTSAYKADVTLTASDAEGTVAESTLTANQSDAGTNKTITLAIEGASISRVSVSVSFNITSPFLATTFDIAGFGLNFRQFFIAQTEGQTPPENGVYTEDPATVCTYSEDSQATCAYSEEAATTCTYSEG